MTARDYIKAIMNTANKCAEQAKDKGDDLANAFFMGEAAGLSAAMSRIYNDQGLGWVARSGRPKEYCFTCPNCDETVYYVRHGKRGEPNICKYRYCPWCGEEVD